ncbi:helix-hairpin-helix domain-containing protein [Micromonospora sp. NPDC006431]|uniref:helix-hairpin-helix domain-containing protein n=1 Tax=Micromonospora sp. NPDC006431 TaxID=3364235 RepID=UPI00367F2808
MSSNIGLWLVVILAVLAGLVIWRVLAGGRTTADQAAPIVEGDPATATGDQERPAAVVDEVPAPTAVTEEPAPAEQDAPPVAAPAVEATTPPSTDTPEPAGSAPADQPAESAPVTVKAAPVAAEVEPAAAPEEPATPVAIPAPRTSIENTTATPVAAPADQAADDFRQIQGIGPKMAAALQAAGIRTYQQLAELDEAALRETIKAAGLRAAPSVATWPQQAKVLAGARAEAEAVLP